MSNVVRRFEERDLCHIVEVNNNYYYVDSCKIICREYETIVFKCNERGEVESYMPVYTEYHKNALIMEDRHKLIIEHLEDYIGG
jgi:hypothetical protein